MCTMTWQYSLHSCLTYDLTESHAREIARREISATDSHYFHGLCRDPVTVELKVQSYMEVTECNI